jgi:hypothetical protein
LTLTRDLAGIVTLIGVPGRDTSITLDLPRYFDLGGSLRVSWYGDCPGSGQRAAGSGVDVADVPCTLLPAPCSHHLRQAIADASTPGARATNIRISPTEGSEQPRIYLPGALSPAVVR